MNFLYDSMRINIATTKKLSPLDRVRLRKLRFKLRSLWNPERADEIRVWQWRAGINSDKGIWQFGNMSKKEKDEFFTSAESFIASIARDNERREKMRACIEKNNTDPIHTAFSRLGLPFDASPKQVRKRFRKLVFRYHPDHGGDADNFISIYQSYEIINSIAPKRL